VSSTIWIAGLAGLGLLVVLGSVPAAEEPGYERIRDVIYGRRAGLALTLDVFQPKAKANGIGLVMIVSSGYHSSPDAIQPILGTELLKRGYTIFAVVHGSQPHFTVPDMIADVNRAVRFVRHNSKQYGIDPDRLGAGGASSGGLLSLMLGTAGAAGEPKAADPIDRLSSKVQAVACFYPPTDFLNYGKPGQELLGPRPHRIDFRAAYDFRFIDKESGVFTHPTEPEKLRVLGRSISPIYFVDKKSAPTLIVHGDKDDLVPIQQAESIMAKFKEAGVKSRLIVKEGAGHGWPTIVLDIALLADWYDQQLGKK